MSGYLLRKDYPGTALFFPFLFLGSPMITHAVGMETFLLLMLVLLQLLAYTKGRLKTAALLSGLGVLARPDAAIVSLLVFSHYLIRSRRFPPPGAVLVFFLPILAWAVFVLLLVLERKWRNNPFPLIVFLWLLVHALAYGLVINPPPYKWYYTPYALAIALLLTMLLDYAGGLLRARGLRERYLGIAGVVLVAGLALYSPLVALTRTPPTTKYVNYKALAKWLNRNSEAGRSAAIAEVGVFGYYYQGRTVDSLGLTSPGGREEIRNQDWAWYIRRYEPDFVVFRRPPRPVIEAMAGQP